MATGEWLSGWELESEAMIADRVGLALFTVLDALEPKERLAFVLHGVFRMTFDEIAPIVDCSPVDGRQLVNRARRRVRNILADIDWRSG